MTPFIKRNLFIIFSFVLFPGLLYGLNELVPALRNQVQHLEFIVISFMIMISLSCMLFWALLGAFGGLVSFLVALIFLYRPITDLNPYYYGILIIAFFLSSFLGYYIYRKINMQNQKYTVTKEKVTEDINLLKNHVKNRKAEIHAMSDKISSLLKLKNIADVLSISLSEEEIVKIVSEEAFSLFGSDKRVLLFLFDDDKSDINLSYSVKGENRNTFSQKHGSIFDRWAVKHMKSLLVKDIKKDFRFSISKETDQDDTVSLIIKPLIIESNILGLLRIDSKEESKFGQYELRLLDIIGELAAVALENAKLYSQTEELAIRDSLTGLYVHRYFMERLEEEVKRALHSNGEFSLLMMDIDNFKDFNDKYGHISGDAILKQIGEILNSYASAGDIVARYGGEEFAFLSLGSNREKALNMAEDIRKKIESSPIVLRREKCSVTISIGVAVFPVDAKLKEDIIWEADRYLYDAKARGKNLVCSK